MPPVRCQINAKRHDITDAGQGAVAQYGFNIGQFI
jgi:hypothetical protein